MTVFRSIRWRLQLWHGLILLLVLTGFGWTAYRLQSANEMRRVDAELQRHLNQLRGAFGPPPQRPRRGAPPGGQPNQGPPRSGSLDEGPPPPEFAEEFQLRRPPDLRTALARITAFEGETNPFYYVIWTPDGQELARSASAPANIPVPLVNQRPQRGGPAGPISRARGQLREYYELAPPEHLMLVGRSIGPELTNLRQLAYWLTALGGAVLVLGLGGGWWLASRAIRPIHKISGAATRIATSGDLSHRIDAGEMDNELAQLAQVLNATFERLETAFAHQAQFTSDASHELRTPVTVILNQTQTALSRNRPANEYRESLEACHRAAQRMRRLIESLLELARFDAGQEEIKRDPVDLASTTEECFELVGTLAQERSVTIFGELSQAECLGDSDRLSQVITNLLTNAILYNSPGGEVHVTTRRENGCATLSVQDNGAGIPPDHLPHLFDRFYRVEHSRNRGSGGTGLGLAISKAIVDAHHGHIEVTSQPGISTCFKVRLPVERQQGD